MNTWALTIFLALLIGPGVPAADDREKLDVDTVDAELMELWAAYCASLKAGDAEKAAAFFVPDRRQEQLRIYQLLGPEIRKLPDAWSELALLDVDNRFAAYALEDEKSGLLHEVSFLRFPDGKWLISGL